jgi:hypothetical protein
VNWEATGAIAELFGALAVIVSLLYLAFQIRSNSKIARAQSQRELLNIGHWFSATATDRELRTVVQAGFSRFESLSRDEQLQFHSFIHPIAAQIEAAYRMNKAGLLEDASYMGFRDGFISMIMTEGGGQWWNKCSWMFVDFGVEVNRQIDKSEGKITPWTDLLSFFGEESNGKIGGA